MPHWKYDLEEACKRAQIEPGVANGLVRRLEPLFEAAMRTPGFYDQMLDKLHEMGEYSIKNLHIACVLFFEKIKEGLDLEPREISMMFLLHYLMTVESFFSDVVDMLCFALIVQHHDLADFFRRTYVGNLRDLEQIPLADRLHFLSRHDWEDANRAVDRELRNAVAHGSYRIEDDGAVVLERQRLSMDRDDFNRKSETLRDFVYGFWVGFRTNPWKADTDSDGVSDGLETGGWTWSGSTIVASPTGFRTDPGRADTDRDGVLDGNDRAPLGDAFVRVFSNLP